MTIDELKNIISENPVATAIGVGAVGAGTILGVSALVGSKTTKKTKRTRKKIVHTKRGWKQDRKRKSKQKWEVAYRRRKARRNKKSKRGIHYTKNGQPYKILASGKARFIKKTKGRKR